LKVPGQCPLVFLKEVRSREGKAVGSEEGKVLGSGHHCEQRREVEPGFCCRQNLDINVERATLGRNFDVNIGRAAYEACSATWNFGYQLTICSVVEENQGKPSLHWLAS
jgi:hypothetical protein